MKRTGSAVWQGGIRDGKGTVSTESGVLDGAQYSFSTRFETGQGTNPEELLAAAHAGCFSMQLSGLLSTAGHPPTVIRTRAHVTVEGVVPGIDDKAFQEAAKRAKEICPISKAVAAVKEVTLSAKLVRA